MLTNTNPLIWPLLNKLRPTVAAQVRPKAAANQGLVRIPTVPWDDGDRPGYPWYGTVEGTPRLWEFANWNLGLANLGQPQKRLQEFRTNPRALPISEQRTEPGAVRPRITGLPFLPPGRPEPNYAKRSVLIWPLLDRLNPTVAMQARPKATGNQGLARIPVAPWDESDHPINLTGYGQVEGTPRLWELAPWRFALAVLGVQQKRLVEFMTNPRALKISEQRTEPGVIRPLKLPARIATITGTSKDGTGAALGNCVVEMYLTATDEALMKTTSDANGAFSFTCARFSPATHYLRAKNSEGTLVGTTVDTLVGAG